LGASNWMQVMMFSAWCGEGRSATVIMECDFRDLNVGFRLVASPSSSGL
jgi:hypothetical protein